MQRKQVGSSAGGSRASVWTYGYLQQFSHLSCKPQMLFSELDCLYFLLCLPTSNFVIRSWQKSKWAGHGGTSLWSQHLGSRGRWISVRWSLTWSPKRVPGPARTTQTKQTHKQNPHQISKIWLLNESLWNSSPTQNTAIPLTGTHFAQIPHFCHNYLTSSLSQFFLKTDLLLF